MIDLNKVGERVTDFRTQFSGVRPKHLKSSDAVTFKECAVSHSTMPLLPAVYRVIKSWNCAWSR